MNRELAARWLPVMKAFLRGDAIHRRDLYGNLQPVVMLDMKLQPEDYAVTLRTYGLYEKASQVPIGASVYCRYSMVIKEAKQRHNNIDITLEDDDGNTKIVEAVDMLLGYRDTDGNPMGVRS